MDYLLRLLGFSPSPAEGLLKGYLKSCDYDSFISLAAKNEFETLKVCREYGRYACCTDKKQRTETKDLIEALMGKAPIWLYAIAVSAYKYNNEDLLLLIILEDPSIESALSLVKNGISTRRKVGTFINYLCKDNIDAYVTLFNFFLPK